jgi:hypothetical protein
VEGVEGVGEGGFEGLAGGDEGGVEGVEGAEGGVEGGLWVLAGGLDGAVGGPAFAVGGVEELEVEGAEADAEAVGDGDGVVWGARRRPATRRPLVPPRSRRRAPCSSASRTAWWAETKGSASWSSQVGSRPMRMTGTVKRCSWVTPLRRSWTRIWWQVGDMGGSRG